MKDAGVTTVVVRADPITLPAFTREATKQEWFPEWVIGGYPFTDTTTFARTFDQEQWSHAFGLSFLPPNAPHELTPALPALRVVPRLAAPGRRQPVPDLPAGGAAVHGHPPGRSRPDARALPRRRVRLPAHAVGGHPAVRRLRLRALDDPNKDEDEYEGDYAGIDDMVELWWDPEAEGPDEAGIEGTGLYRYVNGGRRYFLDDYTDPTSRCSTATTRSPRSPTRRRPRSRLTTRHPPTDSLAAVRAAAPVPPGSRRPPPSSPRSPASR